MHFVNYSAHRPVGILFSFFKTENLRQCCCFQLARNLNVLSVNASVGFKQISQTEMTLILQEFHVRSQNDSHSVKYNPQLALSMSTVLRRTLQSYAHCQIFVFQ